jgi:hypothetical protein
MVQDYCCFTVKSLRWAFDFDQALMPLSSDPTVYKNAISMGGIRSLKSEARNLQFETCNPFSEYISRE